MHVCSLKIQIKIPDFISAFQIVIFCPFLPFIFFSSVATHVTCALFWCQNKVDAFYLVSLTCDLRAVSVSWSRRYSFPFVSLRKGDRGLNVRIAALSVIQSSCENEFYIPWTMCMLQFWWLSFVINQISGLPLILLYSHRWILRNILKIFHGQRIVVKQIAEDTILQRALILTLEGRMEV